MTGHASGVVPDKPRRGRNGARVPMAPVAVRPVSSAPGKGSIDARRITAHLSALDGWIAMLMAQGVNRTDDGFVALARRRDSLAQQLHGNGATR